MRRLKSLKVFLAVVQYGSFAAAAEHVSLTPAAVGQQMKSLEEELGFVVFDRTAKSVTLNHRGHQFARRAQAIVDLLDEAKYDQDARELAGSMRISAISSAMTLLVRSVITLRQHYPRLSIESGISYSGNLKQDVLCGNTDAALTVRSPHDAMDDVVWTPLYKEPFAFVRSKIHHPGADFRDILNHSIFFQSAINTNTGIIINELMRSLRIQARETIRIDAVRTILELVSDGLGVSILPLSRGFDTRAHPGLHFQFFEGPHAYRTVGFLENNRNTFLTSILRQQLTAELGNASLVCR